MTGTARVQLGDARALPFPDQHFHAIVTDPPYAFGFMGKEWDSFGDTGRGARARAERSTEVTPQGQGHSTSAGPYLAAGVDSLRSAGAPFQAWCEEWAREALRVLKPGGHLLAFGGTRTYHRLACAIEDAGFEIRDESPCLTWCHAQGFPKSLNVSKAIDNLHGAEREVLGYETRPYTNSDKDPFRSRAAQAASGYRPDGPRGPAELNVDDRGYRRVQITEPATEDAARWHGWGTALAPAWEPVIVARRPLTGTVAANVLEHGTGAINVDACRTMHASAADLAESEGKNRHADYGTLPGGNAVYGDYSMVERVNYNGAAGRWPKNLILIHHPHCADQCVPGCPVAELDRQSGTRPGGASQNRFSAKPKFVGGSDYAGDMPEHRTGWTEGYDDSGGASRFFPTFRFQPKADTWERPVVNGRSHATVKPVDLMRWLVRLVVPPGGRVLDPFCGSGATLQAAVLEGVHAEGVDSDPDSIAWTNERLSWPVRVDRDGKFERIKPQPAPIAGQGSIFDELDGDAA